MPAPGPAGWTGTRLWGRDKRKAVVLIMAPHKVEDDPDLTAIADARDLHADPDVRVMVQAALLTPAASAEIVAVALGLDPHVIEAYEALFFNVLDRQDLTYLRKTVTASPTGQPTAYVADTGIADHHALLAAGFNGTLKEVLQLAGCNRAGDTEAVSPAENLMQKNPGIRKRLAGRPPRTHGLAADRGPGDRYCKAIGRPDTRRS